MSRVKAIMLCLLAALAVSATATSLAAASPSWWVLGSLLKGTAAVAETTNVTKAFEIQTSVISFECTKARVKEGLTEAPNKVRDQSEIFEGCSTSDPECTIGTTDSTPLKATLETISEATKLKFEPQSGTTLATFKISGASCALEGTYALIGTMICNYPGVEVESLEHPLEFTPLSGSKVKINSESAVFSGTDKVSLLSKFLWSAR
ncbi:MAG TPA: hypothetical protein VK756_09590 [Solirubrobacteraceae bacterium]|nr:hypothetical protein [Solirubrobacteraceae bacterium]